MPDKARRHRVILELLGGGWSATSQDALAQRLEHAGIRATQATLSRDLRELGVLKGPGGYILPDAPAPNGAPSEALAAALRDSLVRAERAGNLVVLRTHPGRAQMLALEIDRASAASVLGTVAGDDTIFIAARSARQAERILREFRRTAGPPHHATRRRRAAS